MDPNQVAGRGRRIVRALAIGRTVSALLWLVAMILVIVFRGGLPTGNPSRGPVPPAVTAFYVAVSASMLAFLAVWKSARRLRVFDWMYAGFVVWVVLIGLWLIW